MAVGYKAVLWNRFKIGYDLWLFAAIAVFIAAFIVGTAFSQPEGAGFHPVQLVFRAFGVAAFALLTFILAIGPLARLSPRFKPLLYNRRHMGVACFLLALIHAALVIVWYHGFSETNAFVSLLASNPNYDRLYGFPFEGLGLAALLILFVMAATSHDFWLANLSPPFWKAIHMAVYIAYGLIIAHVALGAIQDEKALIYPIAVGAGAGGLALLHLAAGLREFGKDRRAGFAPNAEGWIDAGPPDAIPEKRAIILPGRGGERIAVFRYDGKVSAITNVCAHQNGPLGEGRIIDGCVTCPWHGFQFSPLDGRAPAPFTDKISVYPVKIEGGRVFVSAKALAPGEASEPAVISAPAAQEAAP